MVPAHTGGVDLRTDTHGGMQKYAKVPAHTGGVDLRENIRTWTIWASVPAHTGGVDLRLISQRIQL